MKPDIPDLIDLFNEVHLLDKQITLIEKEVQRTKSAIYHLNKKAKSEEEFDVLSNAIERQSELEYTLLDLNSQRDRYWVEIYNSLK